MLTTEEKKWISVFSLVTLSVTLLPYLLAYSFSSEAWRFSGFLFGVEDGNSYIAKMMLGSSGLWLFRSPYTAFPQTGFLAFFPYILLGKLAGGTATHDQLVMLFQGFRIAAGFFCIWSTYFFFSKLTSVIGFRKWATVIAILGGGFGWLALISPLSLWGTRLPLEFYSPETFGFLSLFGIPHLAAARGCLLLGLSEFIPQNDENLFSVKKGIRAGIWWLLVGFFQPLTIITGWAISGVFCIFIFIRILISTKSIKNLSLFNFNNLLKQSFFSIIISLPWVIYNAYSFSQNEYLSGWYDQNIINSPPINDFILSFLPAIIIIIYLFIKYRPTLTNKLAFLIPWLLLFPLLAYAPYNLQRRLPEGIWVLWVSLMVFGLEISSMKVQKRIINISPFLFAGCTLLIFGGSFLSAFNHVQPVFIPTDEVDAFEAIPLNNGEIVLAGFNTSNALPAWIPCRVVYGHGPESFHANVISAEIQAFYNSRTPDSIRSQFLSQNNISWVFIGPEETTPGEDYPIRSELLHLVYDQNGFQIYMVNVSQVSE